MWEPFSKGARDAVVRAQEVAVLFGSGYIGTEHLTFALADTDDEVGRLFADACDRDAIKAQLGVAEAAPKSELVFTTGAKKTIERAFENARRLDHGFIGVAHLALGLLESDYPPPLRSGADAAALREALVAAARHDAKPDVEKP